MPLLASGPLRNSAYCRPATERRQKLLATSFNVIGCVQRNVKADTEMVLQIGADRRHVADHRNAELAAAARPARAPTAAAIAAN